MATVIISQLPPPPNGTGSGSSKGTDLFPATDTTDTSSAASGTTKKYTLSEIYNFILSAQGLTTYAAVRVATTSALTATYSNGSSGVGATLTNASTQEYLFIDDVFVAVGDRVLVWQQAAPLQNGIYVVTNNGSSSTNWILTRALDYNTGVEVVQFGVVLVNQGTTYAGMLFQETAAGPFAIGVSSIVFALYSAISPVGTVSSLTGTASEVLVNGTTGSAVTGPVTLTTPQAIATTSSPTFANLTLTGANIFDTNSNIILKFTPVASAVNYLSISNNSTGNAVLLGAAGADSNIQINASTKGDAGFTLSTAAVATMPLRIFNGTGSQHSTTFSFANTAASRIVTFPDASGTVAFTSGASGIVNPGLINQLGYYASAGTTISGLTIANQGVLTTDATGLPAWVPLIAGQILIGTTAGAPTAAAINSGTGIIVANGSGSITISATGGGLAIATIAGTTQSAAVNTTYIALNSGQTTVTLPAVYAVGDIVRVVGSTANTGGWIVPASAGDTVRVNNSTTSAGGTVTCTAVAGQCIEVVCDVANSSWVMVSTASVLLTTA